MSIDHSAFTHALDAFDAAATCRRVATSIEASNEGLAATLDPVITGFTTEVWDSAVAELRRDELDELRISIRATAFDVATVVGDLRACALLHERDGGVWMGRYLESLAATP